MFNFFREFKESMKEADRKYDEIYGQVFTWNGVWEYRNLREPSSSLYDEPTKVAIKRYKGTEKVVNIPDKIGKKTVALIDSYAFKDCETIEFFSFPKSITNTGHNVFCGCTSLKLITIPDTWSSIKDGSFFGCESLTKVIIPKNIKYIGNLVFSGCESLEEIIFKDRENLNDVELEPKWNKNCDAEIILSLKKYEEENIDFKYATYENRIIIKKYTGNDTVVKIPSKIRGMNIEIIDSQAFAYNTCIENITIPNNVSCINDEVFLKCSNLKNVTIPESILSIGESVFAGCSSLKTITFKGRKNLHGICLYPNWKNNCNAEIIFKP